MYTSFIGQRFLELYNRQKGLSYSAAEFFDKEMYPLFFEDDRHLMHVSNSPFFQNPPEKELKRLGMPKSAYQYDVLKRKIHRAGESKEVSSDASIYVGFAANGPDQTTSGQVSDINWDVTVNELYASWIGNALAVRVEGSQCLLIDSEEVLWHLFEGWRVYREYMVPVKSMDGRQIETWNGYWLAKGNLTKASSPPVKASKLDTYPWVEVIARLLEWHNGEVLPLYVFSLGQTNTTYGFINIHLPEVNRLREAKHAIKRNVFSHAVVDDSRFWELYEPELSLRRVCEMGEIGLRGLRPKEFSNFLNGEFSPSKISEKNYQVFINIEIWIMAMLNNKTELHGMAARLAAELVKAEQSGTAKARGKTSDSSFSKTLFEARGFVSFVNGLTDMIEKFSDAGPTCREVVDQSIQIPTEQFPLFKALLRFEYTYLKSQ